MVHGMRIALALCLMLLASCASRESGWSQKTKSVSLTAKEVSTLKAEALKLWKKRVHQESLEQALAKFELLHGAIPEDLDTLVYLTRGYYFLADAHYEKVELKKTTYEKATSFGEKAMATNLNFKQKVEGGTAPEAALDTLTLKEVAAIYWCAASLGKWAKSSGIAAQLKYKTRIKAMVERVGKLKPDYFFAAVPRYWGGFYAVAPSFAGGDMTKSREYFEKSLKGASEYQGTKVLMAEVYWAKEQNKKEFEKNLNEVLASKYDDHPEIGPENALEKKKAEKLLKQMDELF